VQGLGLFAARQAPSGGIDALTGQPLPIPHVGWNTADPTPHHGSSPLATHFYFVHSYAVVPDDEAIVAATSTYGVPS